MSSVSPPHDRSGNETFKSSIRGLADEKFSQVRRTVGGTGVVMKVLAELTDSTGTLVLILVLFHVWD